MTDDDASVAHPRRLPRVAVVGRQNVGKSTLVNRLLGRREAIAHETPGVTRDRVQVTISWGGRSFELVDTGGFTTKPTGVEATVTEQAKRAREDADVVLLVVDAQAGLMQEDEVLARSLRGAARPVVVVANKADSDRQDPLSAEFHKLGLGEPITVSALHGRGTGDLLERVLELVPDVAPLDVEEEEPRFALVGRPNVGKSSLFNRLLDDERAVVHHEAGTTRDAVDSVLELDGRRVRFIDTAGFRSVVKTHGVEYYGLVRSLRAIDSSHVALLVVDASQGLTGDDKRVAARVAEAGRGLVAALNKWDLVPSEDRDDLYRDLKAALSIFPGTPVLRTSALSGQGVKRLAPALLSVHAAWTKRAPTSEVNRVIEAAVAAHPPPRAAVGRLLYATQVGVGPPAFVLFGLRTPPPAYRRYVENTLRRSFGFDGVPLRLSFRARHREQRARRPAREGGR